MGGRYMTTEELKENIDYRKLIKFLKDNDALDKLERAMLEQNGYTLDELMVERIMRGRSIPSTISATFSWSDIKEGSKFWADLDDKLKEEFEFINLEGDVKSIWEED